MLWFPRCLQLQLGRQACSASTPAPDSVSRCFAAPKIVRQFPKIALGTLPLILLLLFLYLFDCTIRKTNCDSGATKGYGLPDKSNSVMQSSRQHQYRIQITRQEQERGANHQERTVHGCKPPDKSSNAVQTTRQEQ
jgi:hypothetical protein